MARMLLILQPIHYSVTLSRCTKDSSVEHKVSQKQQPSLWHLWTSLLMPFGVITGSSPGSRHQILDIAILSVTIQYFTYSKVTLSDSLLEQLTDTS